MKVTIFCTFECTLKSTNKIKQYESSFDFNITKKHQKLF